MQEEERESAAEQFSWSSSSPRQVRVAATQVDLADKLDVLLA
jgi:hypothetical protein